jgi:hypothetical protein
LFLFENLLRGARQVNRRDGNRPALDAHQLPRFDVQSIARGQAFASSPQSKEQSRDHIGL